MKSIFAAGVRLGDSEKGALFFNEHGEVLKYVQTNFEPHSFYQNPNNPLQFFAFVKEGYHSACLDLLSDKDPKYFDSTKNCFFYGHAQFSSDGKIIYATERTGTGKGKIVLRDSKTLEVINTFLLPGFGPHDMVLCNEGRCIAVVVDNFVQSVGKFSASEVLLLDSSSGKILNKSTLDDEELCLGHLDIFQDSVFAVMHRPEKKGNKHLAYGVLGGILHTTSEEVMPLLQGQGLSIMIDSERKRVITTYPEDSQVTIWDIESKALLKQIDLPLPTGVCFNQDKSGYLISTARSSLFDLDANSFSVKKEVTWNRPYNFFAHLYAFKLNDEEYSRLL